MREEGGREKKRPYCGRQDRGKTKDLLIFRSASIHHRTIHKCQGPASSARATRAGDTRSCAASSSFHSMRVPGRSAHGEISSAQSDCLSGNQRDAEPTRRFGERRRELRRNNKKAETSTRVLSPMEKKKLPRSCEGGPDLKLWNGKTAVKKRTKRSLGETRQSHHSIVPGAVYKGVPRSSSLRHNDKTRGAGNSILWTCSLPAAGHIPEDFGLSRNRQRLPFSSLTSRFEGLLEGPSLLYAIIDPEKLERAKRPLSWKNLQEKLADISPSLID